MPGNNFDVGRVPSTQTAWFVLSLPGVGNWLPAREGCSFGEAAGEGSGNLRRASRTPPRASPFSDPESECVCLSPWHPPASVLWGGRLIQGWVTAVSTGLVTAAALELLAVCSAGARGPGEGTPVFSG